jgi:hypothetical protein
MNTLYNQNRGILADYPHNFQGEIMQIPKIWGMIYKKKPVTLSLLGS